MKELFTILAAFTILVVLRSEGCGDDEAAREKAEQERLEQEFTSMQNVFESGDLSLEYLQAFEKRATQKLRDIADYITLYADSSLEQPFRKQLMQMIDQNFLPDSEAANYYRNPPPDYKNKLKQFNLTDMERAIHFEIDSVSIHKHLEKIGDNRYKGYLRFRQVTSLPVSAEPANRSVAYREMEILALKADKKFGQVNESLWNVYLGAVVDISP